MYNMHSKALIVTLVIVGMFAYSSAQCQPKQPMENYNPDAASGKFYLVAAEKAFAYQTKEEHCGTSQIDDASQQVFSYVITYQDHNGNPQTIMLSVENISPSGTFNVTGGDGTNFRAVVLGAVQDKVHIFYACNPRNNRVAVWVYYSTRVQGLDGMDIDSQRYVRTTLNNNNIRTNDLQDIDNHNCNN